MNRILLHFLMLLLSYSSFASHMVGGGFRYSYLSDNRYLILLDYHKDCSSNAVDYPPGPIRIGIYKKSNNALVQSLDLKPGSISLVNFITDSCVKAAVTCVQKRIYQDTLFLNPAIFDDNSGYYLSYEQCCRNFGIKNIKDPDKSGIAFYADFTPFTKSNTSLRNSSPYLSNEQNVYLCLFENFYSDFSHLDPDGDSLSYKLIDPLMGSTDPVFNNSSGISVLNPKPYPPVNWANNYGISNNNIMDGVPDVTIDPVTGQLNLKPSQTGMYSFAYTVEEYRDDELIGVYNREVQYYIVFCSVRNQPQLEWLNPAITSLKADTITCLLFSAKDINVNDTLNFKISKISSLLSQQNISVEIDSTQPNDLQIKVCFEVACDAIIESPQRIQILVSDNSCPYILYDTLEIDLTISAKINNKPFITWLNSTDNTIEALKTSCFDFIAEDIDVFDSLILSVKNISEELSNQSYEVTIDSTINNKIMARVCFDTNCRLKASNSEGFAICVTDKSCTISKQDSMWVSIITENTEYIDPLLNIPNVFSPNGDGKNDAFSIHNNMNVECVDDFSIVIYNRWGEKVYNSSNFEFEWTGQGLPYGVYFYVIRFGKREKHGHLSIMY
jgi:gliding motility-associated-like protein